MAKDPAFLFYPGDWQGGTMYLTHEQKGCYMDLLILQFNVGKFTIDQAKQVLSICFPVAWPMLVQKFKTDGTFFWNGRLEEEIEKRRNFSKSRRENASHPKKPKKETEAYAKHMENENENRNEDGNTNANFIVPEMFNRFKKVNPIYPGDIKKDYKPLFSIACFLCEQGGLQGGPEVNADTLLPIWEKASQIIAADNFYKSKSLLTISNHIQEIIQIGRNGKTNGKPATGGNVSVRSAFEKIDSMPDTDRAPRSKN